MKNKKDNSLQISQISTIVICLYTALMFTLNFIRIFDNNFWGDECFSIRLAQMSVGDMLHATASDVHPPLYYLILQIFYRIGGNNGILYHLVSIIPYGILLIFSITVLMKEIGKEAVILFITFASLLRHSINYNVEARMYSLAALFVLLSFWQVFRILKENQIRDWILFVLFSLGAAYTHYYALVSVGFFYLFLLVLSSWKKGNFIWRACLACIVTGAGYLPWFLIFFKTFQRTSNSFWLGEIPTVKAGFYYLFPNKKDNVIFWCFAIILLIHLTNYVTGKINRDFAAKEKEKAEIDLFTAHIRIELLWIIAGISSIVGTLFIGEVVSWIFRPLFITRYLFPVAPLAWLIFGICLSRFHWKRIWTAITLIGILSICVPQYRTVYLSEKAFDQHTKEVIEVVGAEMDKDDVILTDVIHLEWTILDYYFPKTEHHFISLNDLNKIDMVEGTWLFLMYEINETQMNILKQKGFSCKQFSGRQKAVDYIGLNNVVVYKVEKLYENE